MGAKGGFDMLLGRLEPPRLARVREGPQRGQKISGGESGYGDE